MCKSTSKGLSAGVAGIGLCAVLMVPGLAGAAASSCRSASASGAEEAASGEAEYSEQEGEYLRLHREVMMPVLFRDLEQAADSSPTATERRAEGDRLGHRCNSVLGDRTEAAVVRAIAAGRSRS